MNEIPECNQNFVDKLFIGKFGNAMMGFEGKCNGMREVSMMAG